jgi:hypothetical protein
MQIPSGPVEFDMTNPYGHGQAGLGGIYDANTQSYTTGEIGEQPHWTDEFVYNPVTGQNEFVPAGSSYSNPGTPMPTRIDESPEIKTPANSELDVNLVFDENGELVPQAAFGGENLDSAIVGDSQVPGQPNEELVIDRHPEPGFDVVPLNQLPGPLARAMRVQEPHLAFGNYSFQSLWDSLGGGQQTQQQPAQTQAPILSALNLGDWGSQFDFANQVYGSQPAPVQETPPATSTPATQPAPPPAQTSPGTVHGGGSPATGTTGTTGTPTTPTTPAVPTTPAQPAQPTQPPPGQEPPNGTVISYPDEVYQSMPTPDYLKGEIPWEDWATLNTGTVTDAFGEELPDIGGINLARAFQLMQDPEAWGALGSRYKSANRNLDAMIARALSRGPRTIQFTPYSGSIET